MTSGDASSITCIPAANYFMWWGHNHPWQKVVEKQNAKRHL